MSLVARHLEAAGLPTVILGSARDVVEQCGVPRFLFNDFPLGNPCGKPWQRDLQQSIVAAALDLLQQAQAPRTTRESGIAWSDPEGERVWKERYLRIDPDDREKYLRLGAERRVSRERAANEGRERS